MMGRTYTILVSVILLFPWSVVGLMVVRALWERGKVRTASGPAGKKARTPGQ